MTDGEGVRMGDLLRRVWRSVKSWWVAERVYPVASTPRRVPEVEVIRGRCWCGDQVTADTPGGWVDAVMLHYRERHPDDAAGQRLAEDPASYVDDEEKFKPRQW